MENEIFRFFNWCIWALGCGTLGLFLWLLTVDFVKWVKQKLGFKQKPTLTQPSCPEEGDTEQQPAESDETIWDVSILPVNDLYAVYHTGSDQYFKTPIHAIACVNKTIDNENHLQFKTIEFNDLSRGWLYLNGSSLNDAGNFCGLFNGEHKPVYLTPEEVAVLKSQPTLDGIPI